MLLIHKSYINPFRESGPSYLRCIPWKIRLDVLVWVLQKLFFDLSIASLETIPTVPKNGISQLCGRTRNSASFVSFTTTGSVSLELLERQNARSNIRKVAGQTCAANCTVTVGNGFVLNWAAQHFTATIVAATVVQVVNTDLHTTRLSTVYNELPAGYTVPTNTNAQGTQTVPVVYVRTGKTLTTNV